MLNGRRLLDPKWGIGRRTRFRSRNFAPSMTCVRCRHRMLQTLLTAGPGRARGWPPGCRPYPSRMAYWMFINPTTRTPQRSSGYTLDRVDVFPRMLTGGYARRVAGVTPRADCSITAGLSSVPSADGVRLRSIASSRNRSSESAASGGPPPLGRYPRSISSVVDFFHRAPRERRTGDHQRVSDPSAMESASSRVLAIPTRLVDSQPGDDAAEPVPVSRGRCRRGGAEIRTPPASSSRRG